VQQLPYTTSTAASNLSLCAKDQRNLALELRFGGDTDAIELGSRVVRALNSDPRNPGSCHGFLHSFAPHIRSRRGRSQRPDCGARGVAAVSAFATSFIAGPTPAVSPVAEPTTAPRAVKAVPSTNDDAVEVCVM
jgi:hypothetical protein